MSIRQLIYPRVIPAGETAYIVEFGHIVDIELNTLVHILDATLNTNPIPGITETVPTYRSLLVMYDPCLITPYNMEMRLCEAAHTVRDTTQVTQLNRSAGHLVEIPVQYGGEWGPDLAYVVEHTNLKPETVINKHTAPTYQVAMLGFAPGFTYLLGLPSELNTPRLPTPRVHIPPGSVGIAGNQTGLYALDTPGGWRIIGRTTLNLFDPNRDQPFLIHAGDRVRFVVEE